MKHIIGIVGSAVSGASLLLACSGSAPDSEAVSADLTTYVAALSVNGDGSDEASSVEASEGANVEPLVAKGCGFQTIVLNVVARHDADQSGSLNEVEKAALVAEFGDADSGVSAEHPNRGQPTRAAVLLNAYDSDDSGSLEDSELAALQADIQARCEERLSHLVEQFDANGDGTLDDSEWEAARAALRERIAAHHSERIAEFDTDGDGQLDAAERAALRREGIERIADVEAEFDANADGQLDAGERAELQEHLRACVKADLPMASREVAADHRRSRPDVIAGEGQGTDAEGSADEGSDTSGASDDTDQASD